VVVQELRAILGVDCADLFTSNIFGTYVLRAYTFNFLRGETQEISGV
jgi:hypothetical protein